MRWLFIAVLAILVCLILSIVWMNDDRFLDQGRRLDNSTPLDPGPLTPSPEQ